MDFRISMSSHFDDNVERPPVQLVKLLLLCYNSVDQPSSLSYSREMSWEMNQLLSSYEAWEALYDLFLDSPLPSNTGENYRNRVMSLTRQVNGRPDVPILRMVFEAYPNPDQDDIDVSIFEHHNYDIDTHASTLMESEEMYMRTYGVNAPASKDFIEIGLERFVWGADNNMDVHESHQCVVCIEEYSGMERVVVGRMPCGHVFHLDCIVNWLNVRNFCPLCRYEVPTSDDILNLKL